MTVWHDRPTLYKVGFVGCVSGALMFIVGFCAPAWAHFWGEWSPHITQSMGLWQTCTGDLSICTISVDDSNPGWLKAVRALESVSMFFAVAACIVGLYCNCILKAQLSSALFNKNMETSAVVSVVFGAFGLIIFATQIHSFDRREISMSWGFMLVCIATSIIGFSAFTMLISRRLALASLRDHFLHRQLHGSFHSQVNLPDYSQSDQVYITTSDGRLDLGPPAYETVVNCIPQDEPAPPPYEQVAKLEGQ